MCIHELQYILGMCRFIIYKGSALYIDEVLIIPDNSMLVQSRCATYHPGVHDPKEHRNIRVNGDGFGVAWYTNDTADLGSCVLKFMTPAWSSSNLKNVARHVKAPLIMGHVRAAASGHNPHEKTIVSYENCHPFQSGRYTFMHNGGIPEFYKIKRPLSALIRDDLFHNISGNTDSEYIFYLILELLASDQCSAPLETATDCATTASGEALKSAGQMGNAVERGIAILLQLMEENGITAACSLNFVFTDGSNFVATRFRNSKESDAPSLYYTASPLDLYLTRNNSMQKSGSCNEFFGLQEATTGSPSNPDPDCLSIVSPGKRPGFNTVSSFIVASEPQTVEEVSECLQFSEKQFSSIVAVDSKWHLIPNMHMMICAGSALDLQLIDSVQCRPIELRKCDHYSATLLARI